VVAYALGWTQHSVGVQMIRAAAPLQLLLGKIGRRGGDEEVGHYLAMGLKSSAVEN
jgi:anaerobic selenocysteine-containing dehydrogenase